jgi:hypothetical protein
MATISHIPNPVSISVKTAGYTIPANRYARAVVNVIGSGTFNIGGVTALAGTQQNVITNLNGLIRGAGTPVFSSATAGTMGALHVPVGSPMQATLAATGLVQVFANETQQNNLVHDYFLPAGTVINGTGTWRATVEEYGG